MEVTGKTRMLLWLGGLAILAVPAALVLSRIYPDETAHAPVDPVLAAVDGWRQAMTSRGHECEMAFEDFEEALNTVPARKMELAVEARKVCAVVAYDIGRSALPQGLPADLAQQVQETRDICRDAYSAKERSAHAQIAVLERDLSLDAYREAREASEAVENLRLSCDISVETVMERAGAQPGNRP